MEVKNKITEIRETYTVKTRLKGDAIAADGTKFEYVTKVRYKEINYVEGWARFGHYILDAIIYYILYFALSIALGIILVLAGVNVAVFFQEGGLPDIISRFFSWFVLYPCYYILFEATIQTSPGKLIMKRLVVNEYGEKPSLKVIIKRAYIRVIPFESFSCLSTLGWHDNWTETFVIRKKDLNELNLAMQIQVFE